MNNERTKVLAKSSGITLAAHTRHVKEEAALIMECLPFLSQKYFQMCGEDLATSLQLAAHFHDWGKKHHKWQNACQADYQQYLKWRAANHMSMDKFTAAEYRQYEHEMYARNQMPGPNIFKAKLRHEIASLDFIESGKKDLSDVIKAAIAAHHGKLAWKHKVRWYKDGIDKEALEQRGPFAGHWDYLDRLSDKISRKPIEELIIERFRYSAVRALLQLADTRASRKEGEGEQATYELSSFPKVKRFDSLRPVQEAALAVADQEISILRAATGSGKTYAALLWAERQVEQKKADRLVIAMPTRFTSNALAVSAMDQLGETGLYHSSAWYNRYGGLDNREAKKEAMEAHRMARFLATPVTVCTIDHLLISLTGTKEQHHSTFYFLANSAVVLDEADFYDPFIQANIVVLIEVLRALQVPILIMSATVPDSAKALYKVRTPIIAPRTEMLSVSKKLHYIGTDEDSIQNILQDMLQLGHGIIYANTVSRALQYFNLLKVPAQKKGIPLILYHSRFTEPDKKNIEEELLSKLGKHSWANASQQPVKGIAIMTQIGEMSVNISSPIMLSDLCPWDRLAQRVGRLERFGYREEGICYVVMPEKDGTIYPAPYFTYDQSKKKWVAVKALRETRTQLGQMFAEPTEVTPDDFVRFVNQLYPEQPTFSDHAITNQQDYNNLIRHNWLILPDTYADDDEGQVGSTWSSRHIPPQQTVYVSCPHHLSSYDELYTFALEYGVSVPMYLLEKELGKGDNKSRIKKVEIKLAKNQEKILIYFTSDYDSKMGLAFLYDDSFRSNVNNQIY